MKNMQLVELDFNLTVYNTHGFWILLCAERNLSVRLVYPPWINLTAIIQLQIKQSKSRRCRCCCLHIMSHKLKKVRHRDRLSFAGGAGCSCHQGSEGNAFAQWSLCCRTLSSSHWCGQDCQSDEKRTQPAQASAGTGLSHTAVCAVSEFTPVNREKMDFWFMPLSAPQNGI